MGRVFFLTVFFSFLTDAASSFPTRGMLTSVDCTLSLNFWCGYPSVAGVADVLPEKFGIYSLEAGDARVFRFDIEICPEN